MMENGIIKNNENNNIEISKIQNIIQRIKDKLEE